MKLKNEHFKGDKKSPSLVSVFINNETFGILLFFFCRAQNIKSKTKASIKKTSE